MEMATDGGCPRCGAEAACKGLIKKLIKSMIVTLVD